MRKCLGESLVWSTLRGWNGSWDKCQRAVWSVFGSPPSLLPRFPWGLDQVRAPVPAGLFPQPSDRASKSAMDFLRGPQHYGEVQEFVLPLWTSFPFILNFLKFFFPRAVGGFCVSLTPAEYASHEGSECWQAEQQFWQARRCAKKVFLHFLLLLVRDKHLYGTGRSRWVGIPELLPLLCLVVQRMEESCSYKTRRGKSQKHPVCGRKERPIHGHEERELIEYVQHQSC